MERLDDISVEFLSHTLEDEGRAVKVAGETRVPAGYYKLKIWNDGQHPNQWVLDHRAKYNINGDSWFKFPIEIIGIPGFSGVLFHAGIDQSHTEGCILLCDTMGNNIVDVANQGARSLPAVKRFYERVYPILEKGGQVWIEIRDEQSFINALK
jgi:hypothetical protein